ncbi:MAG: radical SAM protein [Deltaproteobacteria bacterium]|nr:radical SAM protein [Candidatus Zymogenaceae bacterium]
MVQTILATREKKTAVLRKGTFGCLSGIPTINVTQGCMHRCVYCYARGYPGLSNPDTVILFSNLVARLPGELDRKRHPVSYVLFNTASDSFQPHPDILDTSVRLMEILLKRHIAVSFLTKGVIPNRFFDLIQNAPHLASLVDARIGMVSVSEDYQRTFEPHAATPTQRLVNIERLMDAGIRTDVRIDPIIPFVTDSQRDFDLLFGELSARGIIRASISALHLRPAIHEQLMEKLPPVSGRLIEALFTGSDWRMVGSSTMSKLVAGTVRERIYDRAGESAARRGITLTVCACKNPDLPGDNCSASPDRRSDRFVPHRQMKLPLGDNGSAVQDDTHRRMPDR